MTAASRSSNVTYAEAVAALADLAHPRDAALAYAELGWAVFPTHSLRVRPEDDGRLVCTCGESECPRAGKHPASVAPRGLADATSVGNRIESWWRPPEDSAAVPWNVSIRTGRVSDLLVLDVAAGADAFLKDLEHDNRPLPETLLATTPSGGRHFFFRYPSGGVWPNTHGTLGRGLNTRGESGWIIAAPSLGRGGARYRWDHLVPPADPPEWLLDRLRPGHSEKRPSTVPSTHLADDVHIADALSGDVSPSQPATARGAKKTWRPDPFAAAAGDVAGDDVRPALEALAAVLARSDVAPETLVATVRRANDSNCRPPLTSDEVDDVAYGALAEEHARQARATDEAKGAPVDPRTPAGQRKLAELRRRQRVADRVAVVPAVRAHLLAHLSVIDYDPEAAELTVLWHETRATLRLPVGGSERELQPAVIRILGDLGTFASRAHEKAKAKHVLAVLRDFARLAPERQVEQEDSEPVQLVDAILTLDIWKHEALADGQMKSTPAMLVAREGFHQAQGLGFMTDDRGRKILVVNCPRLASGAFSKNAQFRGKKAADLKKLLETAPGYIGEVRLREVRAALGDLKFHGIDVGEFARILGRELRSEGREVFEKRAAAPATTTSTAVPATVPGTRQIPFRDDGEEAWST